MELYPIMLFVVLLAGAALALASWLWRHFSHFSRMGVNHVSAVPLLGDMAGVVLQKEHTVDVLMRCYGGFPDDRFVGRYEFMAPFLLIKDPELLKRITVKDFDYFVDRSRVIDEKIEPLFGRALVGLRSDEWRNMRSNLSPAFTSSKIRQMVPFMVDVGEKMMSALKSKIDQSKDGYIDLEAKNLTSRYATDVIATCAFGLEINSQTEDNLFYKISTETTSFSAGAKIRLFAYRIVPWVMYTLKLSIFPKKIREFYSNVVLGAMKQREEMNIHRPDMINLLMEAKKGQLSHDVKTAKDEHAGFATVEESEIGKSKTKNTAWSDMDLVAQAVIFLFAGYETVSTTMAFLLHELAVNPECQEKLVQEIRENEERNNGQFDYNSVQHMTYLDMIVSEVLRKWPAAPVVDRLCMKDYNLGKPNSKATKDIILRKGQAVQIPLWSFQHDPKYFPHPDKFDPERFSEENKHKIDPFTYMPFGLGPRNCIGSRFALCEVKVMAYQLLQHIEVSPCEKTTIPIRLCNKNGLRIAVEGGHWLRFRARK
uniref:unspecific monooxygenase n=1 Tax=Adoxophyes honmai TaxID=85585 RepID=A0A455R2Z3_ADOHO|nr:cytochrome P450 monooxygenase [Adoxophyes honmai]